ncbi:hypothetical protein LOTGIDRAFT_159983 [Lottia gigantea]|uniref:Guanine nucleotide exchange factor VAV2 n=1 Tax=Lottia gigantea TaxID=225164 RepID=V3ZWV4_LOTGI|nr:hypothetical protein LOTGIDRAFT_159983 [Lottia gigantea]ESO96003.1 hypothetical protein LOTGIDRAFT_159983 [Lottia gigantea]
MASDEWRMCTDWLVRCQILPSDHKANQVQASAFDLAQALRDGVLICHLLNQLSPSCVDQRDFSPRPQMSQFLCMKNIRTFLQTCKRNFGLRDCDLFQPVDLFDVKNFRKVLETLSKLSKTDLAVGKYRGFPNDVKHFSGHTYNNDLEATGFPPDNVHSSEDEDIYGNLQDLADENDLLDQEEIYDSVQNDNDDDEIYNDVIQLQKDNRRLSTQSLPPPTCKREHCIKELIDTEKNYVDALNMIVVHFIKKLTTVLNVQERGIIFGNIEKLYEIHKAFYDDLLRTVMSSSAKLADIFIRYKTELVIYGDYCANLPSAQESIDKLCEAEMPRQKIQECERNANEGKFRLRDLLSVPMQRVLKYHLLLRELIKSEPSHPDKPSLEGALAAMQDLSLYVNEVKRDHESLQLIEEIQNSIVDLKMPSKTTLRDYGRFQKDGELKVSSHMDSRVRNRHIFLFDKVMLMCKARSETYSYKDAIVLAEFKIDETQLNNEGKSTGSRNWNWPFIMFKKGGGTAYTFFAKTEDARQKWVEAINMALDNTQPQAGPDYIMYTFDKPRECDVCHKLLRGVFFQGYLCQSTSMAVHKECINKEEKSSETTISIQKARANKPYSGTNPAPNGHHALRFNIGDNIEVLDRNDSKFWKGRFRGDEGYFPADHVTLTKVVTRKTSYIDVRNTANGVHFISPSRPETLRPLEHFPWFVGEMERDTAHAALDISEDGTFLIRRSINPARNGLLSLSIKYANAVRHIKVNESNGGVYLAENKVFDSVQRMVEYYQNNTLQDSFPDVKTTLKIPYQSDRGQRILGYAIVLYDYAATSISQVSLITGDRIAITSKNGNDKGWWKGKNLNTERSGYFPLAYVTEDVEGN